MQVEFLGGPVDGHRMEVPDETTLWVVSTPPMSAAEFIAAQDRPELFEYAVMHPREFAYQDAKLFSEAGMRVFRYVGERVAK